MFDWSDHFADAREKWKDSLMSYIDSIDMLIFLQMHGRLSHFNLHAS